MPFKCPHSSHTQLSNVIKADEATFEIISKMPFASEFRFPFQTPAGFTNNVRIFEYRTGSVFEF
jgi:hypothetical protein